MEGSGMTRRFQYSNPKSRRDEEKQPTWSFQQSNSTAAASAGAASAANSNSSATSYQPHSSADVSTYSFDKSLGLGVTAAAPAEFNMQTSLYSRHGAVVKHRDSQPTVRDFQPSGGGVSLPPDSSSFGGTVSPPGGTVSPPGGTGYQSPSLRAPQKYTNNPTRYNNFSSDGPL